MKNKNNQEISINNDAKIRKTSSDIILYCCILFLFMTTIFLSLKIESLSNQIAELANIIGYNVDSHENDEKSDMVIKQSEHFKNSEYYRTHLVNADTKRKDVFTIMNDTYYILFSNDDCTPCIELESLLDGKDLASKNLYFMNVTDFNGNTEIQMEDGEIINEYETTVKDFNVRGTPSLLKICDKKCLVFIGTRSIINELDI